MLKLKKVPDDFFCCIFFNRLFHSLSLILLLIFLSQLIIIISLNVWIFWYMYGVLSFYIFLSLCGLVMVILHLFGVSP